MSNDPNDSMRMESHKRILGILYVVSAIFLAIFLLVFNVFLSAIFTFALSQAEPENVPVLEMVSRWMQWLPMVIVIFFALPSLIAGVGLLNNKSWAMVLALILGCFKLFSFPIGTAVGIYTIWVYIEDQRLTKLATVNS